MEDIKLKDLIYIKRNILTSEQCDNLIKEFEERKDVSSYEQCYHAVTNVMTQSTFEAKYLVPETDNFDIIHSKTNEMINDWIMHLDKFGTFHIHALKHLLLFSHRLRLLKYNTGAWIHPHIDWDNFIHGSCTIALNDDYEGGDFSFWNGKHKVKLNKGDAMIFPADCFWVHEVEPITSGVRYSTNSFITSLQETDRAKISSWWFNNRENESNNKLRYKINV